MRFSLGKGGLFCARRMCRGPRPNFVELEAQEGEYGSHGLRLVGGGGLRG